MKTVEEILTLALIAALLSGKMWQDMTDEDKDLCEQLRKLIDEENYDGIKKLVENKLKK